MAYYVLVVQQVVATTYSESGRVDAQKGTVQQVSAAQLAALCY